MLLRDVEVDGLPCDVRLRDGVITAVGDLHAKRGEPVLEGDGGAVIPGLADHHVHLLATAAARMSIDVSASLEPLSRAAPTGGWLRGVGLTHDDLPDRRRLDLVRADVPVRVQDRSGALWVLNSVGLRALGDLTGESGVDLERGLLWRRDDLLARLPRTAPDVEGLCADLLRLGVTHLTDATPALDEETVHLLRRAVPQNLLLLGDAQAQGPYKVVIADHDLPSLEDLIERIALARPRAVAVHCVTAAALALVVAALEEVGVVRGDRVEHAAVAPPGAVGWLAQRRVAVVTQPSLPVLRAEAYARDVPAEDQPDLWRHQSLLEGRVTVACSSDAPYGSIDPWAFLRATRPEGPAARRVLQGYLADPLDLHRTPRRGAGERADLVLLDAPLSVVLREPSAQWVRATLLRGNVVAGAVGRAL